MKRLIRIVTALMFATLAIVDVHSQSNTIQLRNGANTTTILPSTSTTITVQIPSLSSGTHYLLTSTTNPGSSGAAGSFLTYGATSAQNTDISATNRLFNVGYSATAVEQNALGGLITSTATGTDKSATALTLAATKTGTGTATALYITNGSLTFTDSDDSHITSFTTGNQAADINYTLPTTAGTNGQALITDGSGGLSWGAAGASTLDGLTDAKSGGTDFVNSLLLGHQTVNSISAAERNVAVGLGGVLQDITTGVDNTTVGYSALPFITIGAGNTAIGSKAGMRITTAQFNTILGAQDYNAGSMGHSNTAVGHNAQSAAAGEQNTTIGFQSGFTLSSTSLGNVGVGVGNYRNQTDGDYNIAIGYFAINSGRTGSNNIAIGFESLKHGSTGDGNVMIGYRAGMGVNATNTSANNVVIGYNAGAGLTTGSSNVLIGNSAGSSLTTTSNVLYIDNSSTSTPLIYGDFSNGSETVTINGTFTSTGDVTLGAAASATGGSIIMHDNSTGDSFTATISSANLSASRAYTIPEAGADASFVMTEGAQTINGAKTFGSAAVFNTSAKLKSTDGTGGVILQAGAMSNTNVTYTLPTADGTNGFVLTTNGSGTLSWAAASGGANAINDLTDAVKDITNFTNSMILGHQTTGTLTSADSAVNNTAVGMTAMDAITTGDENTIIGSGAGSTLTSADGNTLVGYLAGRVATGGANTAVGGAALYSLTSGAGNVAVGHGSGYGLTTTDNNIAIGFDAIRRTPSGGATGIANIAIGWAAMEEGTTGADNVMIGKQAGRGGGNNSSARNVVVGSGAGFALTDGSDNVLIGYQVGNALTTQSNLLYIDNSNTATPLIQGNFSTDALTFNGSTTTTGNVTVQGTTTYTPPGSAKTITATTTSGSGAPDITSFTDTYEKVEITATTGAGFVQLPAGTDGQVLYLRMNFIANGSNTVTIVNSNNSNTAMVYDGTGTDVIVAHMLFTTGEGWVVFSALEYDN